MTSKNLATQVIIVGGGPCGLVLAIELGRRGIDCTVLNERRTTTPFPQANATQARTMEHYRRLGIAEKVRNAGLPSDYTTDAACFTRIAKYEIARFEQPSSGEATSIIKSLSGSWSAAELPHRGAQMHFERVLFEKASKLSSVHLMYGWRLASFSDTGKAVAAVAKNVDTGEIVNISGSYLVGCDGPRSVVRKQLDIQYEGKSGVVREFMGGRMLQAHIRAPGVYDLVGDKRRAWQYWAINREKSGFITAVDGMGEFVFVIQLRPDQNESEITEAHVRAAFEKILGAQCHIEIISVVPWTAGLVLVAQRYQSGRVFIAGDAAHLFTPSGGLGYNTAVEDAVNLAWKLAAVLRGWGGAQLLATYEQEMQPLARRNTRYADYFADTIASSLPPELEDDTEAGAEARKQVGAHWNRRTREVLNIPGVTFGGRYDGSPLIVGDGTEPPPDRANIYVPTATPGGRAPHAWLSDGRSLFDTFGDEFSLLKLGEAADPAPLMQTASRRGIPLSLVDLTHERLCELYQASLVIIRPDQIVAWRGTGAPHEVDLFLDRIVGHASDSSLAA